MRYLAVVFLVLLSACGPRPEMTSPGAEVGRYHVKRFFIVPDASLGESEATAQLAADFQERVMPLLKERAAAYEEGRPIDVYIDLTEIRPAIAYPAVPLGSEQASVQTSLRLVDYHARQLVGKAELAHYVDYTPGMDDALVRQTLAEGYAQELMQLLYPYDPLKMFYPY